MISLELTLWRRLYIISSNRLYDLWSYAQLPSLQLTSKRKTGLEKVSAECATTTNSTKCSAYTPQYKQIGQESPLFEVSVAGGSLLELPAWSFASLLLLQTQVPIMVYSDFVECDVRRRQHRRSFISTLRYKFVEKLGDVLVSNIHDMWPLHRRKWCVCTL